MHLSAGWFFILGSECNRVRAIVLPTSTDDPGFGQIHHQFESKFTHKSTIVHEYYLQLPAEYVIARFNPGWILLQLQRIFWYYPRSHSDMRIWWVRKVEFYIINQVKHKFKYSNLLLQGMACSRRSLRRVLRWLRCQWDIDWKVLEPGDSTLRWSQYLLQGTTRSSNKWSPLKYSSSINGLDWRSKYDSHVQMYRRRMGVRLQCTYGDTLICLCNKHWRNHGHMQWIRVRSIKIKFNTKNNKHLNYSLQKRENKPNIAKQFSL